MKRNKGQALPLWAIILIIIIVFIVLVRAGIINFNW